MSSNLDLTEQEQASLAELAELDMALARHVHAHALAADDPATIADLARAYQRIARSARQSLALTAKLRRDAARDALEAAREARLKADRDAILAPFAMRYARPAYEAYDDEDEADEDYDEDEDQDGPVDDDGEDPAAEEAAAAAPAASSPAPAPDPAVLTREAELRTALRRLIWDERERLETEETPEDLFVLLDERLEAVRRWPAPAARPLDEDVVEVSRILGLPARPLGAWRSLPDPEPPPEPPAPPAPSPPDPDPADPWRSSA